MSTRESRILALSTAQTSMTRNTLGNHARQAAIEALDAIVAGTTDLALSARQAHWNVRGRQFAALHELFGRISDDMHKHTDVLAERAAALGGIPRCTAQSVVAGTKLKAYPSFGFGGHEHLEELATRVAALSCELRTAILEMETNGDPVTAHLLTEACATLDHLLWQLESHTPVDDVARTCNNPV